MSKLTVWLARDNDGRLGIYAHQPEWRDEFEVWISKNGVVGFFRQDRFPDVKNGECVEAEIVIKKPSSLFGKTKRGIV